MISRSDLLLQLFLNFFRVFLKYPSLCGWNFEKKGRGVAGEGGKGWFENMPDFYMRVFKREMAFSVGVGRPYIYQVTTRKYSEFSQPNIGVLTRNYSVE